MTEQAAPAAQPRGCGVFLTSADTVRIGRTLSRDIHADREVSNMRAAGIEWATIWLLSYDGRKLRDEHAEMAAGRLRQYGIRPSVWTFPAPDDARAAGEQLGRVAKLIGADIAIGDVEDPDGARGPMDWEPDQTRALFETTIDGIDERTMVAVTSYPHRRGFGLPWDAMVYGVAMPQLYGTADDAETTRALIAKWREAHGARAVIPVTSLRTPGRKEATTPEQFRARLEAITAPGVDAFAMWSWSLLRTMPKHREALGAFLAAR